MGTCCGACGRQLRNQTGLMQHTADKHLNCTRLNSGKSVWSLSKTHSEHKTSAPALCLDSSTEILCPWTTVPNLDVWNSV